jgi:integrase
MKLNKATAAAIKVPQGKADFIAWDDEIPGFGLRARTGGSRVWVFRYRLGRKQRVMTFGAAPAMSAQEARERAVKLHAQVKLGLDPAAGKVESQARATEIFEYAVKIFLTRQKERLKPRSYLEIERHLLVHCRQLHATPLAKIERRDIAVRLNEIAVTSGPAAANRVRASLSALYSWAMREGLVELNPVANTNRAVEGGARARVLTKSELRQIWNALPDDDFGDIVKLLALTGQRRDEIGHLRWGELDLGNAVISLPPERPRTAELTTSP